MENLLPPTINYRRWDESGKPDSDNRASVFYELTDHIENRITYSGRLYIGVSWPFWADGERKYYIETQYGAGEYLTESARKKVMEKIKPHLEALDITRDKINDKAREEASRHYKYEVTEAARTRDRKIEALKAKKDQRKTTK